MPKEIVANFVLTIGNARYAEYTTMWPGSIVLFANIYTIRGQINFSCKRARV